MNLRALNGCVLAGLVLLAAACATAGTPPPTPSTPTPCATLSAGVVGAPATSGPSGRSTPATPESTQPTLSPEAQATAEARLRGANPGAPTTPAGPAQSATLSACPTNTPAVTVQPQNAGGG